MQKNKTTDLVIDKNRWVAVHKPRMFEVANGIRVEATVEVGKVKKIIYLEVNEEDADWIWADATAFAAPALLVAKFTNRDLLIKDTVSDRFRQNAVKMVDLLESWKWGENRVEIQVEGASKAKGEESKVGQFFSGGVDSFTTYMKHKKGSSPITTFIYVSGFDTKVEDKKLNTKIKRKIREVADWEKVKLVEVKTNVRELLDPYVAWDYSHGSAMAFVALALGKKLGKVYFSGGMEREALRPYGLHYQLDPLWSSEAVQFCHEGMNERRVEKVHRYVAKSEAALATLRVCWKNPHEQYNCGSCEKCIRTMLALETAGCLGRCATFPNEIDPNDVRGLFLEKNQIRYFRENLALLAETNSELAEAVAEVIRKSQEPDFWIWLVRRVRKQLARWDTQYLNGYIYRFMSRREYI